MIGAERWRKALQAALRPGYSRPCTIRGKLAILHCCGSAAEIMGDIVEIGLDVLEMRAAGGRRHESL